MKVKILGAHSSETKNARCASILIDDSLAIDAGGLGVALSLKNQKRLKNILLTHAHFDHIKDIPLVALNLFRMNATLNVHAPKEVNSTVASHLLNGTVYPLLQELPVEKPTVNFHPIVPYEEQTIAGYHILAVPANHPVNTVGYQVRDGAGKAMFYTGDTGPGLAGLWRHLSFQLLIIDTTFPNSYEKYAYDTGHLTPRLLLDELLALRKIKKSLPRIVCIHRDPLLEKKVEKEIAEVAAALDFPITVAREDMRIVL